MACQTRCGVRKNHRIRLKNALSIDAVLHALGITIFHLTEIVNGAAIARK